MTRSRLLALALIGAGLAAVGIGAVVQSARITVSPFVAARGVSPDATADNGQRKLARAEDGTLYLAYSGPVDGVEQAQVSFSVDDGQSWKPEIVLAQASVWSDLATLAAGPDGRLDAAWVDYTSVGSVWYASLQGGHWSEFKKISPGDTYAGFPAMVIVGDAANVLWYAAPPDETREHGSAYEIFHTNQVGDDWSTPELLSANSEDALNPSLAVDASGRLSGAWFQVFQGTYGAQVATYGGGSWSQPNLLSTPEETATGVSIDIDPSGVTHLVWEQTSGEEVGVAYTSSMANVWSTPIMLSTSLSQDPVVASDSQGRVVVLWSEAGMIMAKAKGTSWSETFALGSGTNPSALSGETVLAGWTRETPAGNEVVTSYVSVSSGPSWATLAVGIVLLVAGVGVETTQGSRRQF